MAELRAAVPGDELAVARVHVRAWQVGYRGLMPDAYLDGLRPEDRAARYTFGKPGPYTVVAIVEGVIRGFVSTAGDELLALNIDPESWRHGLGRALIANARDTIARDGHRDAVLWILAGNERAAKFYVSDGWADDGGRRVATVWGLTVDEQRYRRSLETA
jgi:GNAT superfamily N-acetyltransferase